MKKHIMSFLIIAVLAVISVGLVSRYSSSGSTADAQVNTGQSNSGEAVASSEAPATTADAKAEPERFNESDASSGEQATSEHESDKDLRTDMSEHQLTVDMVHLEGRVEVLESRLSIQTPRLGRVRRLLEHIKDDLRLAREVYIAREENVAERMEYLMRLASYEFETACDIAGVKLKSVVDTEPSR